MSKLGKWRIDQTTDINELSHVTYWKREQRNIVSKTAKMINFETLRFICLNYSLERFLFYIKGKISVN